MSNKLLSLKIVKEILAVSEREKGRLRQITKGQCSVEALEEIDIMGWRDILEKRIELTLSEG